MYSSFFISNTTYYVVISESDLSNIPGAIPVLEDLLDSDYLKDADTLEGVFVGPRNEFISPFSTNACDIAKRSGLGLISRIEKFRKSEETYPQFDKMLEAVYSPLRSGDFVIKDDTRKVQSISDIRSFSSDSGLALSDEEITYLETESEKLGRFLTDAEVYAFSQINSEHCRHKIFNGEFVIDGIAKGKSLFDHIKDTSRKSPEFIVSAYKDNVAFFKGPNISRFVSAPSSQDKGKYLFNVLDEDVVLSLKAETHNFPTTVEPFNGASTGSGGEIRDRMAGGKASVPLAGTAVYMTSYTRLDTGSPSKREALIKERPWKYQSPSQILIKASNGASDFGNKFGQPLITGSVYTFELDSSLGFYAYDRVIMLAGGVGYAKERDAIKDSADIGDVLVLLGGENYRIGMGGGSVSSVDTGSVKENIELSAIQRANPEMQKRVFNVIRSLGEAEINPIKLVHDHGAGGHINCFTELMEEKGGEIYLDELPLGDKTLSAFEILCNESQERMGLIVNEQDYKLVKDLADREGAPCYLVGRITGDNHIRVISERFESPFDLPVSSLLGSSPETVIRGETIEYESKDSDFSITSDKNFLESLKEVLALEGVGCKDWLTNKVDRSVSGLVAMQQCTGPLQIPLNDCGVMALDYNGEKGIATAIGHASGAGILSPGIGSVLSVCESLTNLVSAPLKYGLKGVSLSANWMWPCKQEGEDARLYEAVHSLSRFCQDLEIPVPTGKDSLSMTMHYEDGKKVKAPGTVVVTSSAEVSEVWKSVSADIKNEKDTLLLYVDFCSESSYPLGGSAFSQVRLSPGDEVLNEIDPEYFSKCFGFVQDLIGSEKVLACHDISSGGIVVAALEMCLAGNCGCKLNLEYLPRAEAAFSEKPGVLLQIKSSEVDEIKKSAKEKNISLRPVGEFGGEMFRVYAANMKINSTITELRSVWCKPSYLLDQKQTNPALSRSRYEYLSASSGISFSFPREACGTYEDLDLNPNLSISERKIKAAIIREKGTNGDRELAYALYLAGFKVIDYTMHDILNGDVNFDDLNFLAFPGGFSNSDVLGAGKGWASSWKYNKQAWSLLNDFYDRDDTLSIGVCNGCQLMSAVGLIDREVPEGISMGRNDSGKFESNFVPLKVESSSSVMLSPLEGMVLGAWVAHGEGRFSLSEEKSSFQVAATYNNIEYPCNPNGSDLQAAAICSADGRHLAIMPHIERSFTFWQWPYKNNSDKFKIDPRWFSPWMKSFQAAYRWIESGCNN